MHFPRGGHYPFFSDPRSIEYPPAMRVCVGFNDRATSVAKLSVVLLSCAEVRGIRRLMRPYARTVTRVSCVKRRKKKKEKERRERTIHVDARTRVTAHYIYIYIFIYFVPFIFAVHFIHAPLAVPPQRGTSRITLR